MPQYYLYILASRPGGALYVGVTNDLVRRVHEHKTGIVKGFTSRYGIDRLVHFEVYDAPLFGNPTRKEHQALAARMEDAPDLSSKPNLARFVRGDCGPVASSESRWPGQARP